MKVILCLAIASLSLAFGSDASAQRAEWSVIDCAQSRLVAPSGTRCRATNVWGSDDGQGQFQSWTVRGDNPYLFLLVQEGRTSISSLYLKNSTEEYLRGARTRATDGTNFSAKLHRNGYDYLTFTSKQGEDCTGFRKPGPSRSVGYVWVMLGVLCLGSGEKLDQARIFKFMDDAQLR